MYIYTSIHSAFLVHIITLSSSYSLTSRLIQAESLDTLYFLEYAAHFVHINRRAVFGREYLYPSSFSAITNPASDQLPGCHTQCGRLSESTTLLRHRDNTMLRLNEIPHNLGEAGHETPIPRCQTHINNNRLLVPPLIRRVHYLISLLLLVNQARNLELKRF